MKLMILSLALFIAMGCGGANKPAAGSEPLQLQADVLIQGTGEAAVIELTFYKYQLGPQNGNLVNITGKTVIEVEDPSLNGVAMTSEPNASGQPAYRVGAKNTKAVNEISATVNGRKYGGNVALTGRPNSLIRVTMFAK
jgi:hypothetical protein